MGEAQQPLRAMRTKARDGFIKALRDAHRWLDELLVDPTQTIESLAIRSVGGSLRKRRVCSCCGIAGRAVRYHRRRSAPASASPSRGPGNGILWAETGGRFQPQNAGERPEFGSQTATRPLTDRNCEGFCRPGNRVGLPVLYGGGCRDRTDGHRSLASLQNEAARRGFSARNDLSQRMSKSLAGKPKALTINRYFPVSLRFHSLSSRSTAMVVTCSRALRRLQE